MSDDNKGVPASESPAPQLAARAAKEPKSWRSVLRGNVLMMGLVSLFTDFSSEMMNPLLPVFILGLMQAAYGDLGTAQKMAAVFVGMMEGVAEATASLLKIFSGRISDRLGKRKALVIMGYGTSTVVRPMMALVGLVGLSWAGLQVVGLKFLDRIGKGIRTSPRDALIGDSVDAGNRGLAFSFHRAMDHAGAVAGPLVAMALLYLVLGYGRWGVGSHGVSGPLPPEEMTAMRWLFAVALVPGLAAMAALIFRVREIAPAPAPAATAAAAKTSVWRMLPGRFYAFVAIVTLFSLGNSSDLFLLLYAQQLFHFDLQAIILLWVVLHVSKIVFSLPGGILSDRLGRRPVIVAGWIFYAAVYMGMALIDPTQPWQFWALFLAYGVYYGMSEGAEKALVTDFVPSQFRGTAFGIYHGAVGLAALPASLLFGIWWAVIGPKIAFGIGAGLAGLASLLLLVLLASSRREAKTKPA